MEVIKSYLSFIDKGLLDLLKGNMALLVREIRAETVQNDEQAKALFDFKSQRNYDKLKKNTQKVLESLVLMGNYGQSEVQKAYHNCQKGRAASLILIHKGMREAGISRARAVLAIAEKYELTYVAYELAMVLSKHYSIIQNARLYKKYAKVCDRHLTILNARAVAEHCFAQVTLLVSKTTGYTNAVLRKLDGFIEKVVEVEHTDDARIQYFIKTIRVVRSLAHQEYEEVVNTCNEAIAYYDNKRPFASYLVGFNLYRGLALTALKDFPLADVSLKKAQSLLSNNPANWHIVMVYRTILAFHSGQYQDAYIFYKQAMKKNVPEFLKERWRLIGSYIYLLSKSGAIYTGRAKFGIGKFLNETTVSATDKQGLNINILISVLMILLQQKRYGEFIDRMEQLQNYRYRYTRDKATARARLFLQMIGTIAKADFHKRTIEYETSALLKKLRRMPVYASHNWEIELVPFETLWEVVMGMLDRRRRALAV
ncbi:MAG: hypothetical protein AAGG75_21790 [Bacteroidota bacterium]